MHFLFSKRPESKWQWQCLLLTDKIHITRARYTYMYIVHTVLAKTFGSCSVLPLQQLKARGIRYPIWFNSMFSRKWFIQCSIQSCFTQDSIQNIIQFEENSADSIQFNIQGIIDTGSVGKVPKIWPKSVQNRQKRGLFIKNGRYRFKIWFIHSFHDKIQFRGLIFFRNIQFKKLFNNLFSREIQLINWFKNLNLAWFNSTKYSFN